MACGSVYKKNRNILFTNSYFGALMDPVFIVDKNFNDLKIILIANTISEK